MVFAPDTLPIHFPVQWGRYRLQEELGRGGSARVYRASLIGPAGFQKPVAVKLLTPEGDTDNDALLREARIGAGLRHPNIVDIYDCGFLNRRLMIVMELIDGLAVGELLRKERVFSVSTAYDVVGQVCDALEYAHGVAGSSRAPVVHLDLKPANLMVDSLGHVRVVDFGIAGVVGKMGGPERMVHGTPGYMAPEVAFGETPDQRSDLFALGMILAQLVLGRLPWAFESMEHFRERLREKALVVMDEGELEILEERQKGLGELVWECLQQNPADRIQNVLDFRQRLDELKAHQKEPSMLRALMKTNLPNPGQHWQDTPTQKLDSVLFGEAPSAPELPVTNLGASADTWVERPEAQKAILLGLRDRKRLVTLVGPGGVGKTRLAFEFGRSVLEQGLSSVWCCDLTEVHSALEIAQSVVELLQLRPASGTEETLVERVGPCLASRGNLLLVLDNVEHLLAEVAKCLDSWFEKAPKLWVLATSRQRLRHPEELVVSVGPLPTSSAIALFVSRSKTVNQGREVVDAKNPVLVQLVAALDNLPLAIELAAGRTAVLSPAQILGRLQDRLTLLSGGNEDSHHRTLRATIDWSWTLLEPWEKAAMAQLSVFRGGFTVEAAEAVVSLDQWPDAPWILFVLESLMERSLLYDATIAGGSPRFSMLLMVRDYAAEQLNEQASVSSLVRERHLKHMATLGNPTALAAMYGPGTEGLWRHLVAEQDNLAFATRTGILSKNYEAGACCWLALSTSCRGREKRRDLLPLVDDLEAITDAKSPLSAWVALHTAIQPHGDDRISEQRRALETALKTSEQRGWTLVAGRLVSRIATFDRMRDDHSAAEGQYIKALKLHRSVGDLIGEMYTLGNYSQLASDQGNMEDSLSFGKMALSLARQLGHLPSVGGQSHVVGIALLQHGEIEEAQQYLWHALRIATSIGDLHLMALAYLNMGASYQMLGEWERARVLFQRGLPFIQKTGNRRLELLCLGNIGEVTGEQGDSAKSIQYLSRAIEVGHEMGLVWEPAVYLTVLGFEEAKGGSLKQGREHIVEGESLLRIRNRWYELGLALCLRGELELLAKDLAAARKAGLEVATLIKRHPTSPDSELRKRFRDLNRKL